MRFLSRLAVSVAFAACAFPPLAEAWDTKEVHVGASLEDRKWISLLGCLQGESARFRLVPIADCAANEHEIIADYVLARVAPGSPWAIGRGNATELVDLNDNWFRRDQSTYDVSPDAPLYRRHVPNPPHFAGLADISYTMHDWINRNRLCPARPPGNAYNRYCYNFAVFHGAGFNSSHFGSQATRSYQQLHQVALMLAGNARAMREAMTPEERELHVDALREAELMALAYEGTAQHFLQDRWAMGHMWDRWGPPDYRPIISDDVGLNLAAGAISGIIHGSQAVTGLPAPMSSPTFDLSEALQQNVVAQTLDDLRRLFTFGLAGSAMPATRFAISPVEFREGSSEARHAGVGDYRFRNLITGDYRVELGGAVFAGDNQAIDIAYQRDRMFACTAGGFYEVIAAFGQNGAGYGVDRVALSGFGANGLTADCYEAWATNAAVKSALDFFWLSATPSDAQNEVVGNLDHLLGGLVRTAAAYVQSDAGVIDIADVELGIALEPQEPGLLRSIASVLDPFGIISDVPVPEETDAGRRDRLGFGRIAARIRYFGTTDPYGTQLAGGGALPNFGAMPTGKTFPVARYFESAADFTSMPLLDPQGRDRASVMGFFNRGAPDLMCSQGLEILEQTRGSSDPRERGVCRYIAEKMFSGTMPGYQGSQTLYNAVNPAAPGAQPARPLCTFAQGFSAPADYDPDHPYFLHPTVVPYSEADPALRVSRDVWDLAPQAIANWCDRVPSAEFVEGAENADRDVAVRMTDPDAEQILRGRDFGDAPGRLFAGWDGNWTEITTINDWDNDEIRFNIADQRETLPFRDREIRLAVEHTEDANRAAETLRSAGRFVLLDDIPRPYVLRLAVTHEEDGLLVEQLQAADPAETARFAPADWFESLEPVDAEDTGPFRPIPPGESEIVLEFDRDIEAEWEETRIALGDVVLEGTFETARRWRGTFAADGDAYRDMARTQALSVMVRAETGATTDSDPEMEGDQPESFMLVVDTVPNIVRRVTARGGRTLYDAYWTEADGIDADVETLARAAHPDVERRLHSPVRLALPPDGMGEIEVTFLRSPQSATVEILGQRIALEGEGTTRTASFDLARLSGMRRIELYITAQDETGKGLDADPRTPALIELAEGRVWSGYEGERGGAVTRAGGPDRWHRLGAPPDLSMVIMLDGSGSMAENGRMESARAGIIQTLEGLDPALDIEMSVLVFAGCGLPSTVPFTTDRDLIRRTVEGATANGATALAAAYAAARNAFRNSADPAAASWRYVTFSDGMETCDGDVGGQMRALNQEIAAHRADIEEEPAPPPIAAVPPPPACFPDSWSMARVDVASAPRILPNVTLTRLDFLERRLADGRCEVRLTQAVYAVSYGRATRPGAAPVTRLQVNARPSSETRAYATSDEGEAALARVRAAAGTARGQALEADAAHARLRQEIERLLLDAERS